MAKKIKPKVEFTTLNISSEIKQKENKNNYNNLSSDNDISNINSVINNTIFITDELKEKLSHYDVLLSQNLDLINQNNILQEKLVAYIEEINSLKMLSTGDQFRDQNILKLQEQISSLQIENQENLLKISELTFQNAKLQADIDSNIKNITVEKQQIQPVFRNSKTYFNNGYGSWN